MSEDSTPTETTAEAEAPTETFSLEYVQQLRSEAAKYRQDKKQAVQAAAEQAAAEWQVKLDAAGDENADLQVRLATTALTVNKYEAMIAAGIPTESMPDVLALVNGHDEESIADSVAKAKALMGRSSRDAAVDPFQGHGNAQALNGDELENTLRQALGI